MRLRTVTGTRWPALCACGCRTRIEPSTTVKVVVDFESRPRRTWLPEHAPEEARMPAFVRADDLPKKEEGRAPPGPAPTPAATAAERAPAPPLALLGSDPAHADEDAGPSPLAGRAWSSGGLTVNAGRFESVRSGYADYALPGETAEQLGVRVNAVIEADLRAKLALLARLHHEFALRGAEVSTAKT